MATDDIVERIRKLLRLAGNAGATEAEAAAALERANALLIRHSLTMDAVAVSAGDRPPVTEDRVRTGWAGNWRGSLVGILARHNLCSPIIGRAHGSRSESVVVVGRPANVQATLAMFAWISAQLERFAQQEWVAFDRAQRRAVAAHRGVPWCRECEDWTETYRERGRLLCDQCDGRMRPERPVIHGFTWKSAFYRGALRGSRTVCTSNARCSSGRPGLQPPRLPPAPRSRLWCCAPGGRTTTTSPDTSASCAT